MRNHSIGLHSGAGVQLVTMLTVPFSSFLTVQPPFPRSYVFIKIQPDEGKDARAWSSLEYSLLQGMQSRETIFNSLAMGKTCANSY